MSQYKIHYKLTHANGALVDVCWDDSLNFTMGDGQLDACLERCVLTAKVGELQTFLLTSEQAFGDIHDEAFQVLNRCEFPPEMILEKNAVIEFKTPTGEAYAGCVECINNDKITMNFNHPLAGCDVVFQVKIIEKTL
jgi:FKBP-type peptidyl-prolyl cis-trans isomerase 2